MTTTTYEDVKAEPSIKWGYITEYAQGKTHLDYDEWFDQQWNLTAVRTVEEYINE
jgi:hypothetical protein